MKKHFVITNVPTKLPFTSTILYSFLLHYFKVDNLWWGIFIMLYFIYWVVAIILIWNNEKIDLNDDKRSPTKSKFAERLEQILNDRKNK